MALKLGRRPPKNAPALRFARLMTGVVPTHPAAANYLAPLPGWQMLGNDQYGDCVAVTWANFRRLITASLTDSPSYPDLTAVEAFYRTQNPGFPAQDDGMDIQTALETLVHDGGPDGVKAVAFAKLDPTDLEQVKAATAIFGGVWTGINVRKANMDQFDHGLPWDYAPASPSEGGHSVLSGGYTGSAQDDVRFITWARETGFTDAFWQHDVDEAWVVIWPEHLGTRAFQQGIDLAALAADYKAITGRDLPVPVTPPAPPADADHALWTLTAAWANARHSGANREAADAVKAWAKAKGLA